MVSNTTAYAESWRSWWIECQPPDRATTSWPLPRECLSATQWGKFTNGGKYGIFLFVVSLSWWARSLKSVSGSPDLAVAIGDLGWILHQLTDALMLKKPISDTPMSEAPASPQKKRKIVLTEKAAAAGDAIRKRYRR